MTRTEWMKSHDMQIIMSTCPCNIQLFFYFFIFIFFFFLFFFFFFFFIYKSVIFSRLNLHILPYFCSYIVDPYTLEPSQRDDSNEYQQYMLQVKKKKNLIFSLKLFSFFFFQDAKTLGLHIALACFS